MTTGDAGRGESGASFRMRLGGNIAAKSLRIDELCTCIDQYVERRLKDTCAIFRGDVGATLLCLMGGGALQNGIEIVPNAVGNR